MIKPGIQSTEFYGSGAVVLGMYNLYQEEESVVLKAMLLVAVTLITTWYTLHRTKVKEPASDIRTVTTVETGPAGPFGDNSEDHATTDK